MSALVIVELANEGIVFVCVVSPLNWYKVFPLNSLNNKGVPVTDAALHANLILEPNFNWNVATPLVAEVKQAPAVDTKVKAVAVPIDSISPIWYPGLTEGVDV